MSSHPDGSPDLDHLARALVSWGATASQMVCHMEAYVRSGATHSSLSTVEAFTNFVRMHLGCMEADLEDDLAAVARVVEAIDRYVRDETLLLAPPEPCSGRSRRRRRARGCA